MTFGQRRRPDKGRWDETSEFPVEVLDTRPRHRRPTQLCVSPGRATSVMPSGHASAVPSGHTVQLCCSCAVRLCSGCVVQRIFQCFWR
ncbi:hypothetical protein BCAL_3003 [Bifidobacterium callitrichos DSM 23973]|uniref:Uncharacterized protein n=1 Tax=Bifidobacterium callitrichos DSM 23973 TaxID=1437609 RepID=A0A087A8V6_9BIFI|nr:hypothetical protein BCAL_3003 [Bifidobacterium callitrichos DSM 23973]